MLYLGSGRDRSQFIEDSIRHFPDVRIGKNTVYEIRDAVLSAFSVFFMQCPSFLAHQEAMQTTKGKNNAETILGVHKIPTDCQRQCPSKA